MSVLIVDDDPGVLETLGQYFSLSGFALSVAGDGKTAAAIGMGRVLDAIVSDVRLPDISGVDVLTELRAAGVRTPFVMISGCATVQMVAQAMRAGANDFLEKPVDAEFLVRVVHSLVNADRLSRVCALNDVRGRPETPSRLMYTDRGVGVQAAIGSTSKSPEISASVIVTLVREIVRGDLRISQFLAYAETLRRLTIAPVADCKAELQTVQEGVAVREHSHQEPSHTKVKEALALLALEDASYLRMSERDIGRVLGIDAAHLGRLMHRQTGRRFREWRRAFRMKWAIRLLAESDEHIRQIAYHVGYTEETQFTHDCSRMFGLCPRAVRRIWRVSHDKTGRHVQ